MIPKPVPEKRVVWFDLGARKHTKQRARIWSSSLATPRLFNRCAQSIRRGKEGCWNLCHDVRQPGAEVVGEGQDGVFD
eukprot:3803762-Rhodomonas_salina.2